MNTHTHEQPGHVHAQPLATVHDTIELCLRCHQECTEAFQYCIQRGGEHADPHLLKLIQTCTEICYVSARFMMLQSPYQNMLCEVCSQICSACAKSCEEMQDDALNDAIHSCLQCADVCRR